MNQLFPLNKCRDCYNSVLAIITCYNIVVFCNSSINPNKSALKGKATGLKLKDLAARWLGTGSVLACALLGTEIFKLEVY